MALESNEAISPALKYAPPMSEELRKVTEQALLPTFEANEDIYDEDDENEGGLLPSSWPTEINKKYKVGEVQSRFPIFQNWIHTSEFTVHR